MMVFGTVIYAKAIVFLDEFVESLNKQTNKNFDLLVINDGADEFIIRDKLSKCRCTVRIINNLENLNVSDLRVKLIEESKRRGYDFLIFGDIDDLFSRNRVKDLEVAKNNNLDFTFFYNSLFKFDLTPAMEDIPKITDSIEQLIQYNYIGLSNSSLNLNNLSYNFINSLKGYESFVFDWYLFSRIVCMGERGLFVREAKTYYRIYEDNFVGLGSEVKKELEVKKKHYATMAKYNPIYLTLFNQICSIDVESISDYSRKTTFWWNKIILQ